MHDYSFKNCLLLLVRCDRIILLMFTVSLQVNCWFQARFITAERALALYI